MLRLLTAEKKGATMRRFVTILSAGLAALILSSCAVLRPGHYPTPEIGFFEEVPGWRMPELAVTMLNVTPERADTRYKGLFAAASGGTVFLNMFNEQMGKHVVELEADASDYETCQECPARKSGA